MGAGKVGGSHQPSISRQPSDFVSHLRGPPLHPRPDSCLLSLPEANTDHFLVPQNTCGHSPFLPGSAVISRVWPPRQRVMGTLGMCLTLVFASWPPWPAAGPHCLAPRAPLHLSTPAARGAWPSVSRLQPSVCPHRSFLTAIAPRTRCSCRPIPHARACVVGGVCSCMTVTGHMSLPVCTGTPGAVPLRRGWGRVCTGVDLPAVLERRAPRPCPSRCGCLAVSVFLAGFLSLRFFSPLCALSCLLLGPCSFTQTRPLSPSVERAMSELSGCQCMGSPEGTDPASWVGPVSANTWLQSAPLTSHPWAGR